jgi:hypothetical protein
MNAERGDEIEAWNLLRFSKRRGPKDSGVSG